MRKIVTLAAALVVVAFPSLAQQRNPYGYSGSQRQHVKRDVVVRQQNVVINRNVTYNGGGNPYAYSGGYYSPYYGGDPYNSGVAMTAIATGGNVLLGLIGLLAQNRANSVPAGIVSRSY